MRNEKHRQILFFVSLIGIIVVTLVMGTTYAYQTLVINYKENSDNNVIIEAGKLNVTYENLASINLTNMPLLPDYKTADYTEFTINTNDSSYDIVYQIDLINLEYSENIISESFKYTLTKVEGNNELIIGQGDFSNLSEKKFKLYFKNGQYHMLQKGLSETLRLYLWLKDDGDINNLENSNFKGNIEITSVFSNEINEKIYGTFIAYGNSVLDNLPDDYQKVEYIESTGTQYIDTGVTHNDTYGFEIEFKSTDIKKSAANYSLDGIFGVNGTGDSDTKIWFGYNQTDGTGRNTMSFYGQSATDPISGEKITPSYIDLEDYYTKHNAIVFNNKYYYDNIYIGDILERTATSANIRNLYLFAVNDKNNGGYFSKTKIYKLELYDNEDNLISNLIPCYRKSDNVIGMYDSIRNVFLEKKGTGTFVKGNDVVTINDQTQNLGVYDETTGRYKIQIVLKENDTVHSTYDILLNEPLRKYRNYIDYIDIINNTVVRNVQVIDNKYVGLETPLYEEINDLSIPYVDGIEIDVCSNNNVCASNVKIVTNE